MFKRGTVKLFKNNIRCPYKRGFFSQPVHTVSKLTYIIFM